MLPNPMAETSETGFSEFAAFALRLLRSGVCNCDVQIPTAQRSRSIEHGIGRECPGATANPGPSAPEWPRGIPTDLTHLRIVKAPFQQQRPLHMAQ